MSSLKQTDLSNFISNSWKRCQEFGLKSSELVDDCIITSYHIREMLQQNEHLIAHTKHIFEGMSELIKLSGQVAMLIDPSGTIIYSVGDADFSNRATTVKLQVGANWQERCKGTNAIGLALAEQVPVRVHANEHYYELNRFLTCASAPVFDSKGALVGVINISGKSEAYQSYTLTLARIAAEALQNKLIYEKSVNEHLITLRELEITTQSHPYPLISLDGDNRIMRANQAAMLIVGKDAVGKVFNGMGKGFTWETIHDHRNKVWRSVAVQNKSQTVQPHQFNASKLYGFDYIIGSCPLILNKKELARRAALTDFPVLILGETGTGKELFAQSIHLESMRAGQPFVAVNCSAIPDNLIESELFGYERGAFTGANREGNLGKFEAAHKGTIFLDEIGDMSLRTQAALLRVLQEGEITPVGSVKSKPIDIRVIAATHRNLLEEIQVGRFRSDLYYRLKGIELKLPSLRERSDIILLAMHFLNLHGYSFAVLTEEVQNKLKRHAWQGNIRELNAVLLQAAFLAEGGLIDIEHLQLDENGDSVHSTKANTPDSLHSECALSLKDAEIAAIKNALHLNEWNMSKAASMLQIGRTTLYRKIEEYHIGVN